MPLNFAVVAFIVTLTWMKFEQQFRPGMLLLRTTVFFATLTIRIFIYLFNEWQCRSRIWYTWWVCISKRLKKNRIKLLEKSSLQEMHTQLICALNFTLPPHHSNTLWLLFFLALSLHMKCLENFLILFFRAIVSFIYSLECIPIDRVRFRVCNFVFLRFC